MHCQLIHILCDTIMTDSNYIDLMFHLEVSCGMISIVGVGLKKIICHQLFKYTIIHDIEQQVLS